MTGSPRMTAARAMESEMSKKVDSNAPYEGVDMSFLEIAVHRALDVIDNLRSERDRLQAENKAMREALTECEEYFDNRADAEYFPDSPTPVVNEEMRLLTTVHAALASQQDGGTR